MWWTFNGSLVFLYYNTLICQATISLVVFQLPLDLWLILSLCIYTKTNSPENFYPCWYCKDLLTIDIGENEFVGSIPKWIGHRLSSLMILSLHSNNFYGQISDEICDHINQYFDDFYMIFDLVNTSNQANCTFVHRSPIWILRN